ncbi:hypothetical protein [Granulicella aggregans]|nr:hypothetical protein [Granulicella aggregans]
MSTLILAVADVIHGQHNGDAHRFYIHIAEFVSFIGLLCLLEIQAFRLMTDRVGLGRWLAGVCTSFASFLAGLILFALAGGSAHGDGGPLAVGFGLVGCIGMIGIPISIIGFLVAVAMRRLKRSAVA